MADNHSSLEDCCNLKIQENDTVIIQRGMYYKNYVIKNKPQKLGRPGEGQILLNLFGAVGKLYGTQFKLNKCGKIFNLEQPEEDSSKNVLETSTGNESGFDNRNICDDGQSQLLSKEDIKQLKDSGKSGDEVVQSLVENNKTFKSKTKFSQEKYVSKKQRKYIEYITVHKPSIPAIAHMLYLHDPLRISNLRIDTLAQMLSYCNVQPGGNFGVYEAGTNGLVSAAMLHRMGMRGGLVHIYSGEFPHKDSVDLMNFSEGELETLSFISTQCLPLFSPEAPPIDFPDAIKSSEEESRKRKLDSDNSSVTSTPNRRRKFIRPREQDLLRSLSLLSQGLDGFVVACRQHPSEITVALLSYLKPGHSFAIFSPYKEPLLDLYMTLKNENCVNLRVIENWLRNYQVLPERTHPEVSMSGGGGYLLTGCKVTP